MSQPIMGASDVLRGFKVSPIEIEFLWDTPEVFILFVLDRLTITLTRGRTLRMKLTLPDDSQVGFVLPNTGIDAKGNTVPLKTPPTVSVSDDKILTLVMPNPATPDNQLSGLIKAAGPLGTAQLIIKDEDESTQPLLAIVDFEVVPGELVALSEPTFGPVEKIPAAPPNA